MVAVDSFLSEYVKFGFNCGDCVDLFAAVPASDKGVVRRQCRDLHFKNPAPQVSVFYFYGSAREIVQLWLLSNKAECNSD